MKLNTKTILTFLCISHLWCGLALAQGKWFHVGGGSWVPTQEMLNDMKANLGAYIKNESAHQGRPIESVDDYVFQYKGETENGYKIIHINSMCEMPRDWPMNSEMVFVLDGGSCYFNLKYETQKRVFYNLIINGDT